jgi:rubrerythrin
MENDRQKDANSQLQIAAMKEIMGGKISQLENMLRNQATPKEALTKTINEALELQQTLQSLKGENTNATNVEEKKMMALTDLVGKVTTNLQPVFMELAKGVGKGGQRAVPSVSIEPGAEPDGSSFPCSKCGTSISTVGNPRAVSCPNCGAVYRSEPPEMPPSVAAPQTFPEPYMARKAPNDEELVMELDKQPLEFLQEMAKSKGIDPDLYPLKHDLIRELLRRRS